MIIVKTTKMKCQHIAECIYVYIKPFHDGGRYHIETSPLICRVNQWTGFYMITPSVMKGLLDTDVLRSVSKVLYS